MLLSELPTCYTSKLVLKYSRMSEKRILNWTLCNASNNCDRGQTLLFETPYRVISIICCSYILEYSAASGSYYMFTAEREALNASVLELFECFLLRA